MRAQGGIGAVALCALGLLNCNATPSKGQSSPGAAPSAAQSDVAPLEGGYRVDAMLGLNEKAVAGLGGTRVSMEDAMRKSATNAAYVYSRFLLRFSKDQLVVRNDMVIRFQEGFQWATCEGTGSTLWRGKELSLPGGVKTEGRSGFVSKDSDRDGSCNANIAAGTYTITTEGGETRLLGSKDGANFAFVLVKDDTDPDVESRARALAGNPKK